MHTDHKTHVYQVDVRWTGNIGQGTGSYKAYERSHEITVEGKQLIPGSSDPAFRGDKTRYNPEELLVQPGRSKPAATKGVITGVNLE